MAVETKEKYCPICGKPVAEASYNRFGEWCCSEAHADEYVKEVRGQKVQAVAAPQDRPRPEQEPQSGRFGRRGGCC